MNDLSQLGIEAINGAGTAGEIESFSPGGGKAIARVRTQTRDEYDAAISKAHAAFLEWAKVPAPKRGEIVREIAVELRAHKAALGALITREMGKILAEGEGEVQEMIDIADFAVGLSRQLYGKTMHSERPGHRMYEQWHPLGVIGVISAFNFPVAVWAWNAMLAMVCGNAVVWKPSPKTTLCAIAVHNLCNRVMERHGFGDVLQLAVGSNEVVGEAMLADKRLPLISFTGSSAVGRRVASVVGARLGRSLLELGGNNAIIVMEDASFDLALRGVLFGSVGTAGQRCTSTRRLFLQHGISERMTEALIAAYRQVKIGDPLQAGTLMGPLVSEDAVKRMQQALETIRSQGGEVIYGGAPMGGCYVEPALVRARHDLPMMQEEVFAPILYLVDFQDLETVLRWHNAVPQGLSSSIFTNNLIAAETFLSQRGSDCGIANVNIGTSGAEIGGAFGGEKDTGGGRESGSDSWKAYMRRQTNTINWSRELPLAQGIEFGV
jgi:aldehyde dehydrogenase (NAD+)